MRLRIHPAASAEVYKAPGLGEQLLDEVDTSLDVSVRPRNSILKSSRSLAGNSQGAFRIDSLSRFAFATWVTSSRFSWYAMMHGPMNTGRTAIDRGKVLSRPARRFSGRADNRALCAWPWCRAASGHVGGGRPHVSAATRSRAPPSSTSWSGATTRAGKFCLKLVERLELLKITSAVLDVVDTCIARHVMPEDPAGDALHLALASVHR